MSPPVRLWLVRHGQSLWNAQGRIQGQSGEGLTDLGHRQAKAVAAWLPGVLGSAPVATSDLVRAAETAAPIAAALRVEPMVDVALRERSFGEWEGATAEHARTRDPQVWAAWTGGEADAITDVGGEPIEALHGRVLPALGDHVTAARALGHEHVVVVSHGGVVWAALHALLDLPPITLSGIGNTGVSCLVFDHDRVRLETFNSMAHLEPGDATTFTVRVARDAADGDP